MKDEVKTILEGVLVALGFPGCAVSLREGEGFEEPWTCDIFTAEPALLIGPAGRHLDALERLFRVILSRRSDSPPYVRLDINHYRKEREEWLRTLARKVARDVSRKKQPILLKPLAAAERRIIHVELASHPDVITESQGEEPKRLLIKPFQI
ncbi:hypothetical protein HYV98_00720 [Candidatus Azambacteria bacterium]|nr:hypothetical protein [Candidatus Azambacteria bacterium]